MDEEKTINRRALYMVWLAVLSVVLVGTLIVVFVEKNNNDQKIETEDNQVIESVPVEDTLTAEELEEAYVQALVGLKKEVEESPVSSKEELISKAADRLLLIRVPGDKRDAYMNVFLMIDKLSKTEGDTAEITKTKILGLLDSLIQHE